MRAEEKGEFRTAWRYALGAFFGIAGGFGSLYFYASGLFIKPLAAAYGWSRSEASFGPMAMSLACVIAYPLAGRIADKVGVTKVAFLSALLLSVSFVLLGAFTAGLASFLFFVFLLTLLSSGSTPLTYNSVVVRHFVRRRGLALGIVLTGTGVGAVLVPALLVPLIDAHGWRAGYYALAAAALPLALISGFLLRGAAGTKTASVSQTSWLDVIREPAVLAIGALIFLTATSVFGTSIHLVPMLTDRGFSPAEAGGLASSMGLAIIFGRVITGHLLDRCNPGLVTAGLLAFAACGQILLCVHSPVSAVAGAVLIGFGLGTESDLMAYLLGRRVAPHTFTTAYGALFGVHAAGAGVGAYAAGLSFDLTGDYRGWLGLAAMLLAAATVIALRSECRAPA